MVQRAEMEYKTAFLNSDFGFEYTVRIFGEDIVNRMPKYIRGANKGQIKGAIGWLTVSKGGWRRDGDRGRVVYPGQSAFALLDVSKWNDTSTNDTYRLGSVVAYRESRDSEIIFRSETLFPGETSSRERERLETSLAQLNAKLPAILSLTNAAEDAVLDMEYKFAIPESQLELYRKMLADNRKNLRTQLCSKCFNPNED